MTLSKWSILPVLTIAPSAIVSQAAYAAVYLDEAQAQQAIFKNAKMTKNFVTLTKEQAKEIENTTDVNLRNKEIKLWKVDGGGTFIIDEVLGKHEFITYAVGINKDSSVKQIEIMNYNETYGYEVRDKKWRDQFVGKNSTSIFKLDKDIKNISGATLSCKHLTDGVKRVVATYNLLLQK